jgi:hypothetical protein
MKTRSLRPCRVAFTSAGLAGILLTGIFLGICNFASGSFTTSSAESDDRASVSSDAGAGLPQAAPNAIEKVKLDRARQAVEAACAAGTLTSPPAVTAPAISTAAAAPTPAVPASPFPLPQRGTLDRDAVSKAHAELRSAPPSSPLDFEDTEAMRAEAEGVRAGRYPNGADDDATHYARGATVVIHVFVNHLGGTWSLEERDAAAAKADAAKTFWRDQAPGGADLHFDNEGGPYYYYYEVTLPYDLNGTSEDWSEDALAAIGYEDNDADGWIIDNFSIFLMSFDGGYDNVIVCFEGADLNGRAWASFVFARTFLFANSSSNAWCHEWGHIFGACDEYIENGHCGNNIDCGPCQGWYLSWIENNSNCDLAACPQDVPCVMDDNVQQICAFTYNQVGWADDDANWTLNDTKRRVVDQQFVWIYEVPPNHQAYSGNTTDGYVVAHRWNSWSVVGLRSPTGADYDLRYYGDNNHNYLLASSSQTSPNVDFVVDDGNHDRLGLGHAQVVNHSGTGSYRLHYESGAAALYPDGVERTGTWQAPYVVQVWDVPLFGGETVTFTATPTSGTMDFGMALFRSNGDTYRAGRSGAVWTRDLNGPGEVESFSYTVPADDVYGFVLWSNVYASGTYSIKIGPTAVTLAEETPVTSSNALSLYTYSANARSWSVVAARPGYNTNVTLRLFDDSLFQDELATSDDWSNTEFVAADYTPAMSQDYVRVIRESGTANIRTEWEQDDDDLAGLFSGNWLTGHVAKVWDVNMTAGQEYFFREYHPGIYLDTALYLMRSTSGDMYKTKADAVVFSDSHPPADGGEWFNYTPVQSDIYGLVQLVNDDSYDSYTIWFGPKYVLAEDQKSTTSNEVAWSQNSVTARAWTVYGIRSQPGDQVQIELYGDPVYNDAYRFTGNLANGLSYVVADHNHSPLGGYFQRYRRTIGTSPTDIEWEGEVQRIGFVAGENHEFDYAWPAGDVAEACDLHVDGSVAGGQDVLIEVVDLSGVMDFGVALFASNGSEYYVGAASAIARANASGVGGTERFLYHFTRDDWYGLIVYNQNSQGGNYRIRVLDPDLVAVDAGPVPASLGLTVNSENPFTERACLQLGIPAVGPVNLSIFNVEGQVVRTLLGGAASPGLRSIVWDGKDDRGQPVASGVYFARLRHGEREVRIKLVRSQ